MRIEYSINRIAQIILAFEDDYIYDPEHKMRISELPSGKKWFQTPRGWSSNPAAVKAEEQNAYEISKQRQIDAQNAKITPEMSQTEEAYKIASSKGDRKTAKDLIKKYSYELEKSIPRVSYVKALYGNKKTEVLKNPSPHDLISLRQHDPRFGNVGAIVSVSGNSYAFPREGNLHHEIARGLGLKEFTTLDLGKFAIEITSTTTQTLRNTKEQFLMAEEAFPHIQPSFVKDFYGETIKDMKNEYNPILLQDRRVVPLRNRFL